MMFRLANFRAVVVVSLGLAGLAPGAFSQTTKMPSTLRYGSGLMDVPVATVLPHMAITGTYSGFGVSVAQRLIINQSGVVIGRGQPYERWLSDGSLTIGLFDRLELGATLQHYDDPEDGGNLIGGFGRISLLPSSVRGIDLAVGARYVSSPTFQNFSDDFQPNRLGYPDSRIAKTTRTTDEFSTNLTPYLVATGQLPGLDFGFLPRYDVTVNLGWGSGLFSKGEDQEFYGVVASGGIFAGTAVHFDLGSGRLLGFMGEYNGFDANAGVQLDLGGIRVGAFALGLDYDEFSTFRSQKYGVLASVAFCGADRGLCKGQLMDRALDTVMLPPPPPDTVRVVDTVAVERLIEPPMPSGTPATLCLSTGGEVEVLVTAQQDTLVGPSRVSIRVLRPGIVFAGAYAQGRDWFVDNEPIDFDNREYSKSGNPLRLDCDDIMRVGIQGEVPIFAERSRDRPFDMIYVPVRPGVWQGYEHGLQRTRG